ncbi:MAG: HD domain-containing protein [Selenomonadaceae bacterium]|nr:HD domain-containing protein [Selenomonadaceae bacterium]
MTEKEFAVKIFELGGRAYLVGGAVRDKLRGVPAHDKDYCVVGLTEKIIDENFPHAKKFGKSFPVFSIIIDDDACEVALARKERKSGRGYRGFQVNFDSSVTLEEDLYRRDTTINAMAIDILSDELIDPFGGADDVKNKKIRAVSKHFTEDPVRALRAARQAAQFNFEITDETFDAMNVCAFELKEEAGERIFGELETALKTDKPSIFFRCLERAGLLAVTFPEIENLRGKIQPVEFHPEGDAYEHTLKILDKVAAVNKNPLVRFTALAHDFGKGTTPTEILPHHYGHEKRGVDVLNQMNARMTLPREWKKAAAFIIENHMRASSLKNFGKIVDLLISAQRRDLVQCLKDVVNADHGSLPPYLEHAEKILDELLKVKGTDAPPELEGWDIAKWIRDERVKILENIMPQITQN